MERQEIHKHLLLSGEKEKLQESLRLQLSECGWNKQVAQKIQDIIIKEGLDKVTVEYLSSRVLTEAQELVPQHIRVDMYNRIQEFISQLNK